jgi:hypothetical protein
MLFRFFSVFLVGSRKDSIAVIASEEGVTSIAKTHPDVQITIGTVDKELTTDGIVLPGIGDAGDRLFGTPLIDDEEESLQEEKEFCRYVHDCQK